jgi:hypothetical protein
MVVMKVGEMVEDWAIARKRRRGMTRRRALFP